MGHVGFSLPRPGEDRDEAPYNTFLTEIVAESALLGRSNFAAEGLTRDRFEVNPGSKEAFFIQEVTRENAGISANPWAQLAWPTASPTTFRASSVNIPTGAVLVVRSRIHFPSSVNNGVGVVGTHTLEARINYQESGGSAQTFASSRRSITTAAANGNVTLCPMAWFDGPLTLSWVEIQYQVTGAGNVFPENGLFWGEFLHKVA